MYRILGQTIQPLYLGVLISICIGLARTMYRIYGILGREITKYTVICDAYIRFWTTLHVWYVVQLAELTSLLIT